MEDIDSLESRIRELEAEKDSLARENADLRWQLGMHHTEKDVAELRELVSKLFITLEWECPKVAERFRPEVDKWLEGMPDAAL